ncbi:WD domain, G-beta repeat-containing protein, putative [Eimeria necatrix]|uniref:WD domain, G-beta repeat-containing protein, putative n=1 Tax=Eimeria necatrix TaxID=51315 RepID=U6MWN1_9EIME|nr:WD domain, G-beta repeat-containing protein, putative [Eimeria necatrix]CDJ66909.1 WD domain, G-beta repeat-containing protein, putative [Eimeria necatrix]
MPGNLAGCLMTHWRTTPQPASLAEEKGVPGFFWSLQTGLHNLWKGNVFSLQYELHCRADNSGSPPSLRDVRVTPDVFMSSVDMTQQAALQPVKLDAPIKSIQLDGEAQEVSSLGPACASALALEPHSPHQPSSRILPGGDGSLRLFDSKAFSMIGRLQLAAPQDPPVAIACLGDRHALLATASGELLSLVLDLSFKERADGKAPTGPQIKHASVSKIANTVTACFGPTFTVQQSMPFGSSCSSADCTCCSLEASATKKIPTVVESLVGQQPAAGISGMDSRVGFALCLSGGYCSVGAYTRACPDNKWILCPKTCFGVRFIPDSDTSVSSSSHSAASRACFTDSNTLIVARGDLVFCVDCQAQQVTRQINIHEALGQPICQATIPVSVAAICCLRQGRAVMVTERGEALLLEVATWCMASLAHHGIHPHLPRAHGRAGGNPICIAAYSEDEFVLSCDCSISMVHVF